MLLLLGQVCCSEWSLMAFFPGFSSILLIFCPFRSLSLWFCHFSRTGLLFCTTFAHPISHELFNYLVAQFVGGGTG
jgi:hypothetical protein